MFSKKPVFTPLDDIHGISWDIMGAGGGAIRQRIRVEFASGTPAKDVFRGELISDMHDAMNNVMQFLKE